MRVLQKAMIGRPKCFASFLSKTISRGLLSTYHLIQSSETYSLTRKAQKKGKRFYVFLFRGEKKWPHTIYDLLRIRWKRKKVNKPNIFSCVFHDIIKALTYNKRKNPCDNNKLSWLPYARGKYVQLLFYISWLRRDVVVGVGGTSSSAQFFSNFFILDVG